MTQWQAVRLVGVHILKREWIGVVATLIFALYCGFVSGSMIGEYFHKANPPGAIMSLVDLMYIVVYPFFGTIMNRSVMTICREDAYSKRIAVLRALPISFRAILQARLLQSFIMIPIIGGVSLIFQYVLYSKIREALSWTEWLTFTLLVLTYSLIAGTLYFVIESVCNGKQYVIVYTIMMFVVIAVGITINLLGKSLFERVMTFVQSGSATIGWMLALLVLVCVINWLGYNFTLRRIKSRSIML
ncbi:MAG: ABC-2 transporter permease [Candidatus Cohnella colombiensis]|uniref:ABC-2 transporter permease n=1 Tax=Candidatus Cohnella colombiensis TaxID=3121368 RepID=A0AA95EXZ6_9BACL|nr:MAG: ABC-2 transporter permease [Cohnella sp.]